LLSNTNGFNPALQAPLFWGPDNITR
jgi:hypothetical protein